VPGSEEGLVHFAVVVRPAVQKETAHKDCAEEGHQPVEAETGDFHAAGFTDRCRSKGWGCNQFHKMCLFVSFYRLLA